MQSGEEWKTEKMRSILLKGTIEETLTYPMSLVENILEGEWQLALSTISFLYNEKDEENPKEIPREVLKVTANYVMGQDVNEFKEVTYSPLVLSTVRYGAAHGSKSTIGFKNQNFFRVNNPQQELSISLKTIDTDMMTEGSIVFLLILLRRVR